MTFRYKFSNTERSVTDDNGKRTTYKVCDICRAEVQTNYGFEIEYARFGLIGKRRMGLCASCANTAVTLLHDALMEIDTRSEEMRYERKIAESVPAELL